MIAVIGCGKETITSLTGGECLTTSTDITIYDNNSTQTLEFSCYKEDYVADFIDYDTIEWIRSGWNNPRKQNLYNSNLNKRHYPNIRNKLPRNFKLENR